MNEPAMNESNKEFLSSVNESNKEFLSPSILIFAGIIFLLIGIIATLGNVLTTVALSTSHSRKSATTVLVINLSFCILPICIFTMPFITALCFEEAFFERRRITRTSMKAFYILTSICNQVELHTIMALAFNRACAVTSPTFYKQYLNKSFVVWGSLVLIWIYSVVLWIPVSIGKWGYLEVHMNTYFIEVADVYLARQIILITACFILPFIIAVACHVVMFCKFRRSRFLESSNMIRPWKNHVTRTMTCIFLLQWIFSVPHFVIHILKRKGSWPLLWLFLHALYFSRFCINPFVYMISSQRYKKDCFRIIKKMFPSGSTEQAKSSHIKIKIKNISKDTNGSNPQMSSDESANL